MVEFADFDASLAVLADAVARGEAGLLNEDELDRLAVEIPDMRTRLGIRCARASMALGRLKEGPPRLRWRSSTSARAWASGAVAGLHL